MKKELTAYLLELLAKGRIAFSNREAERDLQMNHGAFLDAAGRLQRRLAGAERNSVA
jgi:hypothetical protein